MATENFEGGAAGVEIDATNSIFNPTFGAPEFTASPVHGGSGAGTGGAGFFFDAGSSSMVFYLSNAPSAEVWANCDQGIGAGNKNILQEIFGPVDGTFNGSPAAGLMYDAVTNTLKVFYYDSDFAFQQDSVLTGVQARGWLRLQSWVISQTSRNYKVYDEADTLLVDHTITMYDPALVSSGLFSTGYSLGVMSSAQGAAFDVVVDDFMCPIEIVTVVLPSITGELGPVRRGFKPRPTQY